MSSGEALCPRALADWQHRLAARRHRALVVLAGSRAATRRRLQALLDAWPGADRAIWVGDEAPDSKFCSLAPGQAHRLLGQELQLVVMDAWQGFAPEALGAAGGGIVAGGLLVLLTPPRPDWARRRDAEPARQGSGAAAPAGRGSRFWRHLDRSLRGAGVVDIDADRGGWPTCWQRENSPAPPVEVAPPPDDAEQRQAVAAIRRVVTGRARRPLLLTAHRGRGKSSALGRAAASLLREGRVAEVVVTCADPASLDTLFRQAAQCWPEARRRGHELGEGSRRLHWLPPDQVDPEVPLLLVDEAAALPLGVLQRLLRTPRVVLASTVHGYEGSGRGVDLRLTRWMDRHTPRWRRQRLSEPLRWAADDPLERLLFRALLLDAEPDPLLPETTSWRCQQLDRDALVADEARLRSLFGLLVAAHYRTTPTDLRELLDAPQQAVWTLSQGEGGPLAAAALVASEGGLSRELAEAVARGQRRVRGHLLAQSLAWHADQVAAARQRGLRVVRIAVHADLRRRGLGRKLLAAIEQQARSEGLDWLGSSFALDEDVVPFWHRAGLVPVRLGHRRDAASGAPALQVVRALSPAAVPWLECARAEFQAGLPVLMVDAWRGLEPAVVAALFAGGEDCHDPPGPRARRQLVAFVAGRPLLNCLPALVGWARHRLARREPLPPTWRDLVVLRLVQHRDDAEVVARLGLTGRAELVAQLRAAVAAWLDES